MPDARRQQRRFVRVFLLALLLVTVPVLSLFAFLARRSSAPENSRFRLGEARGTTAIQGLGLNLSELSRQNWLNNGSFEPLSVRRRLRVSEGTKDSLLLLRSEQERGEQSLDASFVGARALVQSLQSAVLSTRKEARVTRVQSHRLSEFHHLKMPQDLPDGVHWLSFASSAEGSDYVLGGQQGYLLTVRAGGELQVWHSAEQADMIAICEATEGFLALDTVGRLYLQGERGQWKNLNIKTEQRLVALASRQGQSGERELLAVGEGGEVYLGSYAKLKKISRPFGEAIRSVQANRQAFYISVSGGKLYRVDGQDFQALTPSGRGEIRSLSVDDEHVLCLQEDGSLTLWAVGATDASTLPKLGREAQEALLLGTGRILLREANGRLDLNSDDNSRWQRLDPRLQKTVERVWLSRAGYLLLAMTDGQLAYALSGVEIQLDQGLEEGSFGAGDVLLLEKLDFQPTELRQAGKNEGPETETGKTSFHDWFISPGTEAEILKNAVPAGGGEAALRLNLSSSRQSVEGPYVGLYSGKEESFQQARAGSCRLSQVLEPELLKTMNGLGAYQVSFWAACSNQCRLSVGLDGLLLDAQNGSQDISGDWRRYQFNFIIPEGAYVEGQRVDFYLELDGYGQLDLDRLSFGPVQEKKGLGGLADREAEKQASFVRLAYLPVGTSALPSEYWLKEGEDRPLQTLQGQVMEGASVNLATTFQLLNQN